MSESVLVEVGWRMNAMQCIVLIEETGCPQFEEVRQQLMHLVVEEGAMAQARDIQIHQVLDQPLGRTCYFSPPAERGRNTECTAGIP